MSANFSVSVDIPFSETTADYTSFYNWRERLATYGIHIVGWKIYKYPSKNGGLIKFILSAPISDAAAINVGEIVEAVQRILEFQESSSTSCLSRGV